MSIYKKIALAVCASAMISVPAFADHTGLYLAPQVGYVLPTDSNVDDGVIVGARLGYDLNSNWAVELESGWYDYAYDTGLEENIDITGVPVLVNLRYNGERCADTDIGWYAFGGVGEVFNDIESNSFDAEIDDDFAWQLGLGLDIPVNDNTTAFVDARYFWNEPDFSVFGVDNSAVDVDDLELQAVMFVAGVKFN